MIGTFLKHCSEPLPIWGIRAVQSFESIASKCTFPVFTGDFTHYYHEIIPKMPFPSNLSRFLAAAIGPCLLLASCERKEEAPVASGRTPEKIKAVPPKPALPEIVSFNEHVQPLLSEYCYHCHGPDSGTREPKTAPLRLAIEKHAFAAREDGKPVIVKGKPAESLMLRRKRLPRSESCSPSYSSNRSVKPTM